MRAPFLRGGGDEEVQRVQGCVVLLAGAPAGPLEDPQGRVSRQCEMRGVERRSRGRGWYGGVGRGGGRRRRRRGGADGDAGPVRRAGG